MPMFPIIAQAVDAANNAAESGKTEISWLYIAGCVLLPIAWGLTVEFAFRWFGDRHHRHKEESEPTANTDTNTDTGSPNA